MKISPSIVLVSLFLLSVTLGSSVHLRLLREHGSEKEASSAFEVFFGEGRRLFANHVYLKADEYFHSGYKPSIFEGGYQEEGHLNAHAASNNSHGMDENETSDGHEGHDHGGVRMALPEDWIQRFGKNFYPSDHTHIEAKADEAELLPWLKLTADLDPNRIETYTVGAYWLREQLNRPEEALTFLRTGLKANPSSYAILMEIGKTYATLGKEPDRARNLYLLALDKWRDQEAHKVNRNTFTLQQILAGLVTLEEKENNIPQAIEYLEMLKPLSPIPDHVQERIEELKALL